ncbi:MAG TPA: hypothetical protein VIY72_07065 [Acidimicrobiales bacterium]
MLDGGYRLLREQSGTVLGLTAMFLVPSAIVAGLASSSSDGGLGILFDPTSISSSNSSSSDAFLFGAFFGLIGSAALRSLGVMYLGVALTYVLLERQAGRRLGARPAAVAALRRSGAVLGSWPLLALASVAAYAACFLPLAVWLTFTAVVAPAIAAEGIGPIAAIGRSFRLVSRRFWVALGVVLLSTLVAQVFQSIFTVIPSAVASELPWGAAWSLLTLANVAAATVTVGPLVLSCVLLYLDLRVRTEGLDLRQRSAAAFSRAG